MPSSNVNLSLKECQTGKVSLPITHRGSFSFNPIRLSPSMQKGTIPRGERKDGANMFMYRLNAAAFFWL